MSGVTKKCNRCRNEKQLEGFYVKKNNEPYGLCISCTDTARARIKRINVPKTELSVDDTVDGLSKIEV